MSAVSGVLAVVVKRAARVWPSVAVRLLGGMFVAAAFAKTLKPDAAAAAMSVLTPNVALQATIATLVSASEGAGGLGLLLGFRYRRIVVLGAVMSGCAVTSQIVLAMAGRSACGCFGDLVVPRWIVLLTATVGCAACVAQSRCVRRGCTWLVVAAMTTCGVVVAAANAAAHIRPAGEAAVYTLQSVPSDVALFVVVRSTCERCEDAMRTIGSSRSEAGERVPVFLVMSENDNGAVGSYAGRETPVMRVAESVWWSLVRDAPPTYYLKRNGRVQRVPGGAGREALR